MAVFCIGYGWYLVKPPTPPPNLPSFSKIENETIEPYILGGLIEQMKGSADPTPSHEALFRLSYSEGFVAFGVHLLTRQDARATKIRILLTNIDPGTCYETFASRSTEYMVWHETVGSDLSRVYTTPVPFTLLFNSQSVPYFGLSRRAVYQYEVNAIPNSDYSFHCVSKAQPQKLSESRRKFIFVAPNDVEYPKRYEPLPSQDLIYEINNSQELVASGALAAMEHVLTFQKPGFGSVGIELEWTDIIELYKSQQPQFVGGIIVGLGVSALFEFLKCFLP